MAQVRGLDAESRSLVPLNRGLRGWPEPIHVDRETITDLWLSKVRSLLTGS
jgi:hypothetical protein